MLRRTKKTKGQALVEFALAATLIFMLLAAAIDLGLMFFAFQTVRTAAQEGATFGSYPEEQGSSVDLRYNDIRDRVRFASGERGQGFANLRDLNNNAVDDAGEAAVINPKSPNSHVYVELLGGTDPNSLAAGACATNVRGAGMQNGGRNCWIRVTVRYTYRFIFPLAPAFGANVTLRASDTIKVRSNFYTTP